MSMSYVHLLCKCIPWFLWMSFPLFSGETGLLQRYKVASAFPTLVRKLFIICSTPRELALQGWRLGGEREYSGGQIFRNNVLIIGPGIWLTVKENGCCCSRFSLRSWKAQPGLPGAQAHAWCPVIPKSPSVLGSSGSRSSSSFRQHSAHWIGSSAVFHCLLN